MPTVKRREGWWKPNAGKTNPSNFPIIGNTVNRITFEGVSRFGYLDDIAKMGVAPPA